LVLKIISKLVVFGFICRGLSSCKNWWFISQSIPCGPKTWMGAFFYSLAVLGLSVSKPKMLKYHKRGHTPLMPLISHFPLILIVCRTSSVNNPWNRQPLIFISLQLPVSAWIVSAEGTVTFIRNKCIFNPGLCVCMLVEGRWQSVNCPDGDLNRVGDYLVCCNLSFAELCRFQHYILCYHCS